MLYVIRDWLPFALVLLAYDFSRERPTSSAGRRCGSG